MGPLTQPTNTPRRGRAPASGRRRWRWRWSRAVPPPATARRGGLRHRGVSRRVARRPSGCRSRRGRARPRRPAPSPGRAREESPLAKQAGRDSARDDHASAPRRRTGGAHALNVQLGARGRHRVEPRGERAATAVRQQSGQALRVRRSIERTPPASTARRRADVLEVDTRDRRSRCDGRSTRRTRRPRHQQRPQANTAAHPTPARARRCRMRRARTLAAASKRCVKIRPGQTPRGKRIVAVPRHHDAALAVE